MKKFNTKDRGARTIWYICCYC